jgi:hypothetical protein
MAAPAPRRGPGRALLVYTGARFGLFFVCLAVFYVAGFGLLWSMVLAAVVSGVAGYFLLQRQRLALSTEVASKVDASRERAAARAAREDAIADEIIAQQGNAPADPQ